MKHPAFHEVECVGKPGFATRLHASGVMKSMLRYRERRGGKLKVYRCRFCRQWHIGSTFVSRKGRSERQRTGAEA